MQDLPCAECYICEKYFQLPDKLYNTKGIVLRSVQYGETSLVVSVYTELFGLQSYMVNGIRASSKKGSAKAGFFQPAANLDLVVYHNEFKQINRIKEYQWAQINPNLFTNVLKNGVALYMVELLWKCVKLPENNPDLFAFIEDCCMHLDACDATVTANFPVFIGVQLTHFFGFAPRNNFPQVMQSPQLMLDLTEGVFTNELPAHNFYIEKKYALLIAELLMVRQPSELSAIKINTETRRKILDALETYYSLHIPDFGKLKTLPVLREIMS